MGINNIIFLIFKIPPDIFKETISVIGTPEQIDQEPSWLRYLYLLGREISHRSHA